MIQKFQRDVFINTIFEAAKKDKNVIFISADFGAPSLDKFREQLPSQFIHSGISEQHMIDMAAGLSLSGHKVFVYAMAPFITLRCLEQIKCSLAMMSLPVTILAVGVGLGYADAGPTHYLNEDIACMRSIVGLDVYSCSDEHSTKFLANLALEDPKLRIIRLERHALDEIYNIEEQFNYDGFKTIYSGIDTCILTYGNMTHRCIKVANSLKKEEINIGLFDVFFLKPFPDKLIQKINYYKKIITIEEQTLAGGFGSIVLENLAKNNLFQIKVINMGLPDKYYFENGGRKYLLDKHGLSVEEIIKKIKY